MLTNTHTHETHAHTHTHTHINKHDVLQYLLAKVITVTEMISEFRY